MLNNEQIKNANLIKDALIKYGVTNKYLIAAILATCYKESNFYLLPEISYKNTSNERIRKIFGDRVKMYNEAGLNELKKDTKRFFDVVYGNAGGNNGEGYKYRGRGFNGITFKNLYKKLGDYMQIDLVKNPDLLNTPKYAAEAAALYMRDGINDGFKNGVFKDKFNINSINEINDTTKALKVAIQNNGGLHTKWSALTEGYNKAQTVVNDLLKNFTSENNGSRSLIDLFFWPVVIGAGILFISKRN